MVFEENIYKNLNKENLKDRLLNGALIIYPTDTVYGLGAIIEDKKALERIYRAKSRAFSSPLIALISSIDKIEKIAYLDEKNTKLVKKLAENFFPGALTIILKRKENVPDIMVSNGDTVGIRMPNLKMALDIIEMAGGVLATTSANISGEASPKSYSELSDSIKSKVDIIINGGECSIGEVSTILDLTQKVPKILRKGAITKENLEKIIGKIEV